MKQYILCAAIWFNNYKHYQHQPKNIGSGIVVCGRRHHNCFITYHSLAPKDIMNIVETGERSHIQGFLTSDNMFVDRKKAAKIAYNASQITKPTKILFPEDLY